MDERRKPDQTVALVDQGQLHVASERPDQRNNQDCFQENKVKERPNDQFGQKESMGGIFSRAMLMEQ